MTKIDDVLSAIDATLKAWENVKIDNELTDELIAKGKEILAELKPERYSAKHADRT